MTEPLRAHDPDERGARARAGRAAAAPSRVDAEAVERAREHAEAEAALAAVMQREQVKAEAIAAIGSRKRRPPLKLLLLLSLLAFNAYAWFGNPEWLRFKGPEMPQPSYYASSWKLAVYLQRQRIEEYRLRNGSLPVTATQAGPPVKGVEYKPLESRTYQLAAGDGMRRFVYMSSDSAKILVGRAFVQMSQLAGGLR